MIWDVSGTFRNGPVELPQPSDLPEQDGPGQRSYAESKVCIVPALVGIVLRLPAALRAGQVIVGSVRLHFMAMVVPPSGY